MYRVFIFIAFVFGSGCDPGEFNGELKATGDSFGNWTLKNGNCYSGNREEFFGLTAHGPEGSRTGLTLVKDQLRGWTAVIQNPSSCTDSGACTSLALSKNNCKIFNADVEYTGTTYNDVREVEGSLQLKCRLADSTLVGHLRFVDCH